MTEGVLELYPEPGRTHHLKGLYLQPLPEGDKSGNGPFIYSNFISSLDGRIALPTPDASSHQVPPAIANARDWRLFQELAAQADLLITSARYFRQSAKQEAQAELPVAKSMEFDDLREWRIKQGLKPQPDIAVFSSSLNIPHSALHPYQDRSLFLVTGSANNKDKLADLTGNSHAQIIICGENDKVDGALLRNKLAELGYRRVYAIAGPSVLHTLIKGDALDRLYHTTAHCLLGGMKFDTFVWGPELNPAHCLPLRAMYYDANTPQGAGQTLAIYGD